MTWQDAIDIIACEAWATCGRPVGIDWPITRDERETLLRWRELRVRAQRAGWRVR